MDNLAGNVLGPLRDKLSLSFSVLEFVDPDPDRLFESGQQEIRLHFTVFGEWVITDPILFGRHDRHLQHEPGRVAQPERENRCPHH
ncbi:MAG: hypothetical protein VYD18_17315, partial [Candidatus Latescibacterota bacterium]|nr:hypothetical protein [Candidatus Latescibacterota bacterium]